MLVKFNKKISIPRLKIKDCQIFSESIFVKGLDHHNIHRILDIVFSNWDSSLATLNFPDKIKDYCCFKNKIIQTDNIKYDISVIATESSSNYFYSYNNDNFLNKLMQVKLLSLNEISYNDLLCCFETSLEYLYGVVFKNKEKYNFCDKTTKENEIKFIIFYKFWELIGQKNKSPDEFLRDCFDIYEDIFNEKDNISDDYNINSLTEDSWNIRTKYYKNIVSRKYEKNRR